MKKFSSILSEASLLEFITNDTNVQYINLPNGYILRKTWRSISFCNKNFDLHRINGPARAWRMSNGDLGKFEFWVNGKQLSKSEFEQHFEIENYDMEPSSLNEESKRRKSSKKITMLPDGSKKVEDNLSISYWKNGKLHRTDGPAFFRKDLKTGKLIYCQYYVDGYVMSYTDWHMHFTDAVVNNVPVMAYDIS